MAKYLITNKAVEDLSKIWEYTFDNWSEDQADKYYSKLINDFQELAENNSLGKKYTLINSDIIGYKSGQHIIFYRILNINEIEIIRVLHSKMDLKNRLKD
ncbi:MAG: type II toxin-antitoxin system RelE/ParE family toxin [Saprospiraceae bacterium]|nr:type II toxin-antitoxin system RelE/ParE family toxin [Saprospiraceae bacterium]